jgi:ABC-2 type transport system ATP-binding protein
MSAVIECRGLSKIYKNRILALNNLNLSLEPGQIVGLLGPNGSGKTTFIKLVNDLLVPTSGELFVDGKTVGVETKSIVSYLPERPYFADSQTVRELVNYFADFYEDFDTMRALEMLRDLGVSESMQMKQLSKGTKEKVQLVLVMSRQAKVYILDEPIGGVDPAARDYILRTILTNYNPEAIVIISTHLISDIENILDHVLFLHRGELVLNASVDDLRAREGKSVNEIFREVFRC